MKPSLYLLLVFLILSCNSKEVITENYPPQVGDVAFDERVDDPNFKICNETQVLQYYNFGKGLQYKGEKVAINQHFKANLKSKSLPGESGFVTIRFIVNCEGGTGRFRTEGMDKHYQKKEFNKELINEILRLTKQLDGWVIGTIDTHQLDYYQYLTFKIVDGKLIEIMP